jgi:molybdopterin-containing oxidoreductase family membrane subunit
MAAHTKTRIVYRALDAKSSGYWGLIAAFGLMALIGGGAAYTMEHAGHWITGMNNHVVWGTPHVFAVFLIVAASGALNVASVSSVFGRDMYKPLARLSGLLALALLAGGLAALLLDLGRPDRLLVTMTNINPTSIFSWNVVLYSGFFAIVAGYLWTMMDRRGAGFYKPAALGAFVWRLILTTGTGSIFGFLVAREAYDAAIMAPLFIAMSLAFGQAAFMLVVLAAYTWANRPLGDVVLTRLQRLTGIMVAATAYFLAVQHITGIYAAEHRAYEAWLLTGGSVYTSLFWLIGVGIGIVVPLVLLLHPQMGGNRVAIVGASIAVLIGGLTHIYVIIIGGQAFPLVLFPGMEVSSAVFDGVVAPYAPTLPEVLLGIGGIGVALLLLTIAVGALRFLPESLADEVVDPDHVPAAKDAAHTAVPVPAE